MKRRVKKLNQTDNFHLRAAEGWFELGDLVTANNELDEIAPEERANPAVLVMRYEIYAKGGRWNIAAEIAEALVTILPDEPESWLNLACATRRKKGGGNHDANQILYVGHVKFPQDYRFPYNFACYFAKFGDIENGDLEECKRWFQKAMALDDKTVQKLAVDDPDLNPLWDSMSGTIWKKE